MPQSNGRINGTNLDAEAFTVDGNEVVEFKLVKTPEDIRNENHFFRPAMCHQIFGEREEIFGYENLRIKLYYSSGWLEIYYGVDFDRKHADVEPADLYRKIIDAYKIPITENLDEFERKLANEKEFKPYGTLIDSFTIRDGTNERNIEIYHCTHSAPGFIEYYERLETFLLWFIDAASFIDCDDPNWNFFIVYEKYKLDSDTHAYGTVGLATTYNFYGHPFKVRSRISQFLILPPFQRKGIGTKLLSAIYDHYIANVDVLDFTVEDPVVDFQIMRDIVDCQRVESANFYVPSILRDEIPRDFIQRLQSVLKLNKRQGQRVCEILRLKNLNKENESEVAKFRLDVKRRLNKPFHRQQVIRKRCENIMTPQDLAENFMSDDERKEKLNLLYEETCTQYNEVIQKFSYTSLREQIAKACSNEILSDVRHQRFQMNSGSSRNLNRKKKSELFH